MAKRVFRLASLFVLLICVSSSLYAQQDEASLFEQASAAFSQQDNEINSQANHAEESPANLAGKVLAQNTAALPANDPAPPPNKTVPEQNTTASSSINTQLLAQNTAAAFQVNPPAPATPAPLTAAPAPNTVTTTTQQTKSVTVSKLMSSDQFQKWLENNGYLQSKANPAQTTMVTRVVRRMRRPITPRILTLAQSQQAMLRTAPAPLVPPPPDSSTAFNVMLQQNMPLTPRQVVRLHQQIDVAQRAAAISPTIPPKPVSTTLMINLAPGTTPPAIRLAQGYVSSLVFVDSTGAPWPIASFDIGNPKAVNMQWDGKSNILLIQAVSPYSNGDIVVRLVGLPTPVTLELVSGQRVVDYRADIHIPRIGPNTKDLPIGTILPSSANQLLLDILSGIAPDGSRPLLVGGGECEAWLLGEMMYIRTRLTLLSPGWIGKMVSPDGMQAYELQKTSSILVSRFGEPVELKIEGF